MTSIQFVSLLIVIATIIICIALYLTVRALNKNKSVQLEQSIKVLKDELDRRQLEGLLQLKDVTGNSLSESEKELRRRNLQQIDTILSPLKEKIDNFNRLIHDSYTRSEASRKSLNDRIDDLLSLNMRVTAETNKLSTALRGNISVQGKWGEMILQSLLEKAGLQKGINYDTQVTSDSSGNALISEEGKRQKPDVVIYLPENRHIIIDSKVSLTAYMDYMDAKTEDRKKESLRRHVESVKRQIDILASKDYQKSMRHAAEQVILFIPNEAAYLAAMNFDNKLWEYAYNKKITIVSAAHLFAVMQIVEQLWRQESRNNNALEIANLGGMLYDSVVAFHAEMSKIEQHLKAAADAYAAANNKLTESNRSVLARAERLRELGIKTSKKLKS